MDLMDLHARDLERAGATWESREREKRCPHPSAPSFTNLSAGAADLPQMLGYASHGGGAEAEAPSLGAARCLRTPAHATFTQASDKTTIY
jgi:hypothetical protein